MRTTADHKPTKMLHFVLALLALVQFGAAQSAECGLNCISNVNGTNCAQSEWTCLCPDNQYLENLNTCLSRACNQTDYDTTISAVAEICAIFNNTPTISPYATATTGTENPLVSTVAIPSAGSLPPVSTSTSSMDNIAGTSISTITTSDVAIGSGATATASASTTTNIAQRIDLKTTALHGIAVALLGLAVYL